MDGATMGRLRLLVMSTSPSGDVSPTLGSSGALDPREERRYRNSGVGWTPGLGIVA